MKTVLTLLVTGLACTAGAASAQDYRTPHPGASALDLHRLDMNRLRIEADARAIEQREHTLTTRLNRLEIQSRRQPPLAAPTLSSPGVDAPLTAQARREAATAVRIQTEAAAGEINRWLDGEPNR